MNGNKQATKQDVKIVYDGECPFCANYVQLLRLRDASSKVQLVDAREDREITRKLHALGYDLNEGMVLILDGHYYHGADCINRLALMSTKYGWFNMLNSAIFRSKTLSNILYPVLRTGRNFVLFLLGREKIKNNYEY